MNIEKLAEMVFERAVSANDFDVIVEFALAARQSTNLTDLEESLNWAEQTATEITTMDATGYTLADLIDKAEQEPATCYRSYLVNEAGNVVFA